MVSTKGDTRAQRLPKETCRFGTDLKFADLQSAKSTKWINDFVASSNNQLVVSTDRYIFQMSALVTLLSKGPQVCLYACAPLQNMLSSVLMHVRHLRRHVIYPTSACCRHVCIQSGWLSSVHACVGATSGLLPSVCLSVTYMQWLSCQADID